MLPQRRAVDRVRGCVSQQGQKVGSRRTELDSERGRVEGRDTESLWRLRARDNLRSVEDGRQHGPVHRAVSRIDGAPQCEHEVFGHDRLTVGPAGVTAQVERVLRAVVADVPPLCHAGLDGRVRAFPGKTLVQIAQNCESRGAPGQVGVEAVGLRTVAPAQHRAGARGFGEIARPRFVLRRVTAAECEPGKHDRCRRRAGAGAYTGRGNHTHFETMKVTRSRPVLPLAGSYAYTMAS